MKNKPVWNLKWTLQRNRTGTTKIKAKTGARRKLEKQLTVTVALLVTAAVFVQAVISFLSLDNAYNSAVSAAQQGFDNEIQVEVQSIISALSSNHKRALSGEIDEKEEKAVATAIVRDSFYNHGNGYFWADNADGTCAVHYRADLVGKQRIDEKDDHGTYYIKNIIAAGNKEGGGFSEFYYTKPGKSGVYLKRVFTQKFDSYGWYISTGAYKDDIDTMTAPYQSAKNRALIEMCAAGLLLIVLSVLILRRMSRKIARPLALVAARLEQLADGDLHAPVPEVRTGNETEVIARAAEKTLQTLRGVIEDITLHLGQMAQGDFTSSVNRDYAGDFAPIRGSIEQISAALNSSLLQMRGAAEQVAAGAGQVAGGAQSLAGGASEQAAALEELSKSVSKVSKDVSESAESADVANRLTAQAERDAEQGRGRMGDMVEAMARIADSSDRIGKIIKTIDSIAFQTNILALNASVEAARAGENGRGFTVVADEVRNLAAKSAEAAKTTSSLIEESKRTVENGKSILGSAEQSLTAIAESTKKSAGFVARISEGTKTQAAALGDITANVDQISRVIQTNSATAEQSAAASEEMNSQAALMKAEVEKFRLNDLGGTVPEPEAEERD